MSGDGGVVFVACGHSQIEEHPLSNFIIYKIGDSMRHSTQCPPANRPQALPGRPPPLSESLPHLSSQGFQKQEPHPLSQSLRHATQTYCTASAQRRPQRWPVRSGGHCLLFSRSPKISLVSCECQRRIFSLQNCLLLFPYFRGSVLIPDSRCHNHPENQHP